MMHCNTTPLRERRKDTQRRGGVPAVLLQSERESETAEWIKEKEPLLRVTDIKNDCDGRWWTVWGKMHPVSQVFWDTR